MACAGQVQDQVPKEEAQDSSEEDCENVSYQVLKHYSEDLALFLESSCTRLATELSGEEFIDDQLHDEIIQRRLTISNWERMQTLLIFIYNRMKKSKDPAKLIETFKEVIDDKAYSGLVKKLGKFMC